jgi:hypothetical protein
LFVNFKNFSLFLQINIKLCSMELGSEIVIMFVQE